MKHRGTVPRLPRFRRRAVRSRLTRRRGGCAVQAGRCAEAAGVGRRGARPRGAVCAAVGQFRGGRGPRAGERLARSLAGAGRARRLVGGRGAPAVPKLGHVRAEGYADARAVANSSTIALLNAVRSSGFLLVTSGPSRTTSSSTPCAPAFVRSARSKGPGGHSAALDPSRIDQRPGAVADGGNRLA